MPDASVGLGSACTFTCIRFYVCVLPYSYVMSLVLFYLFYSEIHNSMPSKRRTSVHEWVLYCSAFIVLMAILSSIHAIGTLFPYFLDEFGENRAKTAAIQSVFYGVGLGCSKYTDRRP